MSLTYSTFVTSLGNIAQIPTTDANFQTVLPNVIDDAELRLYRTLDLLNTIVRDSSNTLSTGSPTFHLPTSSGVPVVTEELNVITPSTQTTADSGTRNQLQPVSKEYINATWNSSNGSTVPQFFAMVTQTTLIVGPWPDAAYTVEWVGTIRPAALSSTNATTLLSVYFPDLLIAASMVFLSGYMKNYGMAVDDPRQAINWEAHYQQLLQSAETEESRKKFTSQGWSSKNPAPLATPPRN